MNKYLRTIASYAVVVAVCAVSASYGALTGVLFAAAAAGALVGPGAALTLGTVFYESDNSGTSLATMAPDDVRKIWQAGLDVWEQSTDFFQQFEGGKNALVWEKTELSAGRGMTMRFTNRSGYYDEPHIGEALFETSDDFEETLINGYNLSIDYLRHATRNTDRMEEIMGMRGEIESGDNEELGKWMGRLKTEQMLMMFRESLPTANILFAGGLAQNTIKAANSLAWDPIVALQTQMKGLGGLPAMVGKQKNGQPVFKNLLLAPSDVLYSLELDPSFRQLLENTRNEEAAGSLFDGGFVDIRGTRIQEYTPIDHDGEGAIGSPLFAKAWLGNAITAGTTAIDITGGGNATSAAKTKKKYFKYFPGYNYQFRPDLTLSTGSTTRYLLIVNPASDATNPNKVGMYAYTTGNNGNKITITARLGSATSGVRATTVGDVTYGAGVWADGANGFAGHTDAHPAGSLILPCNSLGQVFGDVLMLGRGAAVRGYGKWRNKRTQAFHEGSSAEDAFVVDRFITSIFGQAPRQDRLGRVPSATRLRVACAPPGIPLPIVT